MKWNTSSFLENRLFDSRLTKSALVNKWQIDDDIYKQRMDYRHFKETYVLLSWLLSMMKKKKQKKSMLILHAISRSFISQTLCNAAASDVWQKMQSLLQCLSNIAKCALQSSVFSWSSLACITTLHNTIAWVTFHFLYFPSTHFLAAQSCNHHYCSNTVNVNLSK